MPYSQSTQSGRGLVGWTAVPAALCLAVLLPSGGCGQSSDDAAPNGVQSPIDAVTDGQAIVAAESIEEALAAAETYLHSQDLAKAEAILHVLINRAPNEPRAHEMQGLIAIQKAINARTAGDSDAAQDHWIAAYEAYATALTLGPESAGLHQNAGELAHTARLFDEALVHYRAAGRLAPTDLKPPLYEAQVLIEQGALDDAEASLRRALSIDPDEPVAYASLAMVAMEREQFAEALEYVAEARRISPGDLRFRLQEAKIHRRGGNSQAAVDLLSGLPEETRAQFQVVEELAAALSALDRYSDAAKTWELRLTRAPGDIQAMAAAGILWLRASDVERAGMWLKRATELDPTHPKVVEFRRTVAGRPPAVPP